MENLEIIDYKNEKIYAVFSNEDYRYIEDFSYGYAATYHLNGVCGYIDEKGYETLLYNYSNIGDFCNFIAPVCIKKNNIELWGFIDRNFNEIIECKYIFVERFKNYFVLKENMFSNFLVLNNNSEIVYENSNKESIIKYIEKHNSTMEKYEPSIVKKEYSIPYLNVKKYTYEDDNGNKIIPYQNMENRDFACGYVVVKISSNNYAIFDESGKQLKIHTCIKMNAETLYLKNIISKFNLRITGKELDGFSSIIRCGLYEYIVFGETSEELLDNKNYLFDYIEEEKIKEKVIK